MVQAVLSRTWDDGSTELVCPEPITGFATLGLVEVIATLARKHKGGEITSKSFEEQVQEVEADWRNLIQIQLVPDVVESASSLARRLALRGADAIHLASALRLHSRLDDSDQLILVTADRELQDAALASGLAVMNPAQEANAAQSGKEE